MFSRVSWQSSDMTARESTSTALPTRPTSLAKVIFAAWKALQAYFTISAVGQLTTAAFSPKRFFIKSAAGAEPSREPTTASEGVSKSATAVLSRRNSG